MAFFPRPAPRCRGVWAAREVLSSAAGRCLAQVLSASGQTPGAASANPASPQALVSEPMSGNSDGIDLASHPWDNT